NVKLSLESGEPQGELPLSRPLFSWVLENLLRNAVDAMEGEGALAVRAAWEGDEVHVEVEDNGKGMTKSVARR
ncbi:MAG: ATP-binding protein, partial [Flavobacteriales bacterium]